MSRRKQSNPKPLKREDEEWGNDTEAMPGEPRTPSSGGEPAASSSRGGSPASSGSACVSPPRLRCNALLATDPALAPQATQLKHEPPSPSPPAPRTPAPPTPRDYLALTAAAFPALFPANVPPYMCQPCGIRYSSLSTLKAHQEHYCTNRRPTPSETPTDANAEQAGDESSGDSKTPRPPGKQYACNYCSYSADKKVSLNRHMRMHSSSPVSSGTPAPALQSNGEAMEGPPVQDRYCNDCDIRFSSIKTYRAHKEHYCSTRQVVKQALAAVRGGSGTSGSSPPSPGATPPTQAQNQYALALPTNPILIVPYSLLRSASTLPGTTLPDPDTPCFLLPNGTFQPLSRAITVNSDGKEPEVLKSANRPRESSRDAATPLDLSMRRTPESVITDEHEKENRIRSASPEHIVCAPSLPGSPCITPSPSHRSSSPSGESSPKRRRRDSRGATPKPPSVPSPPNEKYNPALPPQMIPPALALRLASELPAGNATPQVLVKQGVSKCKECNIVFYKYDNYRVHKQKYCSAGGGEKRSSPGPPEAGPPAQYRQLICLACGIHFSSLDNLATHQSFYCTKRETRSPRCLPAEAPRLTSGSEWKCPCCDVVSPTAAAAQRHMETHGGVKAFRCTICRYRGNTLRGMRTHIRMHFPKKPADLQEETYIACVQEEDNRETASPSLAAAAAGERVHRCSSCAYTSTYRGNVVRHARLVHATEEPDHEETPSPHPAPTPAPDIKKEPDAEPDEANLNYCKACDISFKYVNTFKAHKQFYCTANAQDAAANNNLPAPPPAARVTDAPVL